MIYTWRKLLDTHETKDGQDLEGENCKTLLKDKKKVNGDYTMFVNRLIVVFN